MTRRAIPLTLATAVTLVLLMTAAAHAAGLTASFDYSPANPEPGQQVAFRATSTSSSTTAIRHSWDLDGDGQFDDATGDTATTAFAAPGRYTVRLKAEQPSALGTGVDVAERVLEVAAAGAPEPAPAPAPAAEPPSGDNQAPVAVFDRKCSKTGTFFLCAGLMVREQKPAVLDASPSHDADGSIVKYEWDLDGNGSFETDAGASPTVTHTFELYKGLVDTRKRIVRVRVTNDKGASGVDEVTLTLLEPSCEDRVSRGLFSATSMCLRPRKVEVDGEEITRYTAELPVVVNGITVAPTSGRTVTIDVPAAGGTHKLEVRSNGAVVSAPAKGAIATLYHGSVDWTVERVFTRVLLQGFKVDSTAKLNGRRITGMPQAPVLASDGISSMLRFYVALPQQFGGSTSDHPVELTPGKAGTSASEPLAFRVANASIGPIGLKELKVTFDGVDLWEIATSIALPDPIPYTVSGDAGIRAGEFEHAGASVDFGTPGIGPFGPVFLQRIGFRVEIKPKQSKCVPKVGIETIDLWEIYRSFGVEPAPSWPRYGHIDHGVPTFALCGDVGISGGPTILGAAAISADAGLGLATYDDRPAVFRVMGKVSLVEIPLAKATFELHTDGYVKARADFDFGIPNVASIEGFLMFEMLKAKFNAEAYVHACIDLVDVCAGARALVSSKGMAVCLHVDVLGANWEPGFGYEWGDVFPTLYFSGCDVGDYREHIAHASAARAKAAGAQETIDLPSGLPGAVVVVEGRDAPPKITLEGPNGERITTPDGMKGVQQKPFLLIKNQKGNLTQVAIGQPAGGRWRVIVEDDSSPVVSVKSAQGLDKPKVDARVIGRGRDRSIAYRIEPRKGQKVTFVERGASAGTVVGEAAAAEGTIRFTPGDGRSERRQIIALVEQDGQLRDSVPVAGYRSPGPLRPSRPGHLRVKRSSGSALRLSWTRARSAREHEVSVRLSDGRRLAVRTRGRAMTVAHVAPKVHGSVRVRGLSAAGTKGPAAGQKVSAARRHRR
jgi:hypothetical protein